MITDDGRAGMVRGVHSRRITGQGPGLVEPGEPLLAQHLLEYKRV